MLFQYMRKCCHHRPSDAKLVLCSNPAFCPKVWPESHTSQSVGLYPFSPDQCDKVGDYCRKSEGFSGVSLWIILNLTTFAVSLENIISHWDVDSIKQICKKLHRPALVYITQKTSQPHGPSGEIPLRDLYSGFCIGFLPLVLGSIALPSQHPIYLT